jgi:hypothetical protein
MTYFFLSFLCILAIIGLCWLIGFFFETGRNMTTKTKKVCDCCFRGIKEANEQYNKINN